MVRDIDIHDGSSFRAVALCREFSQDGQIADFHHRPGCGARFQHIACRLRDHRRAVNRDGIAWQLHGRKVLHIGSVGFLCENPQMPASGYVGFPSAELTLLPPPMSGAMSLLGSSKQELH
jgi:hypothetical protein